MNKASPQRLHYLKLLSVLFISIGTTEALVITANVVNPLWERPNQDQRELLLVLLQPLAVLVAPFGCRLWNAHKAELDPGVLHQALTPERVYIFSCLTLTLATILSFMIEFDGTIWGVLITATVISPALSYAQHAGELRNALRQPVQVCEHDAKLASVIDARDELEAQLRGAEQATLWQRIRRNYPVAKTSREG